MRIIKRDANSIAKEEAHGGSGARKVLAAEELMTGKNLEAVTHGFLPAGATFDWHNHVGTDEVMIVLRGSGVVSDEDGDYAYGSGDVFIFPSDIDHKVHNPTDEEHEMLFVRVRQV